MTRLYASIAVMALAMLAAPKVTRGVRFAGVVAEHAIETGVASAFDGDPERAAIDVIDCIAGDISR